MEKQRVREWEKKEIAFSSSVSAILKVTGQYTESRAIQFFSDNTDLLQKFYNGNEPAAFARHALRRKYLANALVCLKTLITKT